MLAALAWSRTTSRASRRPGPVTIAGQSAGSIAVGCLLACARSAGLFQQAIMQSGPASAIPVPKALRTTKMIAKSWGSRPPRGVRGGPREKVLDAQIAVFGKSSIAGGPGCDPVIDGDLLTADPKDLLRGGTAANIPLLTA